MKQVPQDVRRVAWRLGLGDLNKPRPCHGYPNGCRCHDCLERGRLTRERGFGPDGKLKPAPAVTQPWETAA